MKRSLVALPIMLVAVIISLALQPRYVQAQRPVVVIPMCTSTRDRTLMDVKRTFGALAYDDRTTTWYTIYGYPSKGEAKRDVMSHCKDNGGSSCRLMLSYSNQCAAVARVVEDGIPVPGKDSLNTGSTESQATDNAIRSCQTDWGATCQAQFVNCSHSGISRTKWTEAYTHQC